MYLGVKKEEVFYPVDTSPGTGANRGLGAEVRDRAARRADGSKNANRKLMRSARRWLSVEWRSRSWQGKKNKKPRKRSCEGRRATDAEREGLTDRPWEEQRERVGGEPGSGKERGRTGIARVRGRTGTRGIQQLPLNVFNAAVEVRKRSVGRSHRSAPRRSRWGWTVWAGRSGGALASYSSWTSVSLYTYTGRYCHRRAPVKHGGYSDFVALRAPTVREAAAAAATGAPGPADVRRRGRRGQRTERETAGWRFTRWYLARLTAERTRVNQASRLFEPSDLTDNSPPPLPPWVSASAMVPDGWTC